MPSTRLAVVIAAPVLAAAAVLGPSGAQAQQGAVVEGATTAAPTAAPEPAGPWRFQVEPYAFVPLELIGTARVRDRSIPVYADIGDVLSNLRFAAAVRGEAWYRELGVILDARYVGLGSEGSIAGEAFEYESRLVVGDALLGVGCSAGAERPRMRSRSRSR